MCIRDSCKIVQKVRSVLDDCGELISPDESAYLPNIADISFISGQIQHEDNGAALSVFERESDDKSWKPIQDDGSVHRPKRGETAIISKWVTQIASHMLNTDTCMTQIRYLATKVQKCVWWCRLQVDRAAEATFQAETQGVDALDTPIVNPGLDDS